MMPSKKQQKSLLRPLLKKKLDKLGGRARAAGSLKILKKVLKNRAYQKSKRLLTYVSFSDEVGTAGLIRAALRDGKQVYVPLVRPGKNIHIYRILDPAKDLRRGAYGIMEPKPRRSRLGRPSALDLVFVPGLGFDAKGNRLGRGGGYFDRFLLRVRKAVKIGLAFRCQIMKKIPVERHDRSVDRVITG